MPALTCGFVVSIRRKAIAPYTFADGTHIANGNWTCVPLRSMGLNNSRFPNASTFDGFRFCNTSRPHKFTDIDVSFPFWGFGKEAWYVFGSRTPNSLVILTIAYISPGRHYASFLLKTVLAHILQRYDFKLDCSDKSRTFSWRTTVIPRFSTTLLVRNRQ